jgi:hypothetical protein
MEVITAKSQMLMAKSLIEMKNIRNVKDQKSLKMLKITGDNLYLSLPPF